MSRLREYLCVVKPRGLAPEVMRLREGYEHEALDDAVVCRPFDGRGTQQIAFNIADDANALCGPLIVTGIDAKGERRSLEPIEAQMIVVQLRERCRGACARPCGGPEAVPPGETSAATAEIDVQTPPCRLAAPPRGGAGAHFGMERSA
jgi:hypothetical protein